DHEGNCTSRRSSRESLLDGLRHIQTHSVSSKRTASNPNGYRDTRSRVFSASRKLSRKLAEEGNHESSNSARVSGSRLHRRTHRGAGAGDGEEAGRAAA